MHQTYKKIIALISLFLLAAFIATVCYLIVAYLKWGLLGCIIFLIILFVFPAIPKSSINGVVVRLIFWSIDTLKKEAKIDDPNLIKATRSRDCPSDKILIQYMTGKMKKGKEILSQHIACCKYCQDTLKELKLINEEKVMGSGPIGTEKT